VLLLCCLTGWNALAQGTIYFSTKKIGVPVYYYANSNPLSGTNFLAQLYYYPGETTDSSRLTPIGVPVNFRTGTMAGYVQESGINSLGMAVNNSITIPDIYASTKVTLELRVWKGNYASYEAAIMAGSPFGQSSLFNVILIPKSITDLTGLQTFCIVLAPPFPTFLQITEARMAETNSLHLKCQGFDYFGGPFIFQVQTNSTLDGTRPWGNFGDASLQSWAYFETNVPVSKDGPQLFYRIRCSMP
jgi:hypothetical protein